MAYSPTTRERVAEIAGWHGFSAAAAEVMLGAVARGRGAMAQFDHPEFGGPGQWMRRGMTMVGDMFNTGLKARVEALCADLAALVADDPTLMAPSAPAPEAEGDRAAAEAWWPAGLPEPDSTGAQNETRYAWFAAARRLAIERRGVVTLYATLDHRITGFAQQQSGTGALSFTSQHGPVDVEQLPVASVPGASAGPRATQVRHDAATPATPPSGAAASSTAMPAAAAPAAADPAAPAAPRSGPVDDVITAIERLAELRARGILSEAEFATKKAELLGRI